MSVLLSLVYFINVVCFHYSLNALLQYSACCNLFRFLTLLLSYFLRVNRRNISAKVGWKKLVTVQTVFHSQRSGNSYRVLQQELRRRTGEGRAIRFLRDGESQKIKKETSIKERKKHKIVRVATCHIHLTY